MYQAGIKQITLIENKDVDYTFYDVLDENKITDLTFGTSILLDNVKLPKFDVKVAPNNHGKLGYEYKVEFYLLGYILENVQTLETLRCSIYGWTMLVDYYDGTKKYYPTPMYFNESKLEPQTEMSYECVVETRVPTEQTYLEYSDGETLQGYRADTTLLTADTTLLTADYAL